MKVETYKILWAGILARLMAGILLEYELDSYSVKTQFKQYGELADRILDSCGLDMGDDEEV